VWQQLGALELAAGVVVFKGFPYVWVFLDMLVHPRSYMKFLLRGRWRFVGGKEFVLLRPAHWTLPLIGGIQYHAFLQDHSTTPRTYLEA
jgi:hypothetical protein